MKYELFNGINQKKWEIADKKRIKRRNLIKLLIAVKIVSKIFTVWLLGSWFKKRKAKKKKAAANGKLLGSEDLLFTGNFAQQMFPSKP